MVKRWFKNRISYIHLSYDDLHDFDTFVIKLLENLKEKQRYSLLIKVNFNVDEYAMVGSQVAFSYEDENDFNAFEGLHETFKSRIRSTLDNYNVYQLNSVQILRIFIDDFPELELNNVNSLEFTRQFSVENDKQRFHLIPLTVDMNYFGDLIINDCSLYLNRINKQRKDIGMDSIHFDEGDKMYLYQDNLIIINKIDNNKGVISRNIYNAKSGYLIDEVVDYLVDDTTFTRQIGNVLLTISGNKVIKVASKKALLPIKFKPTALKDEANPFIGSWDVEAFDDVDGYAKVYALGFAVLEKGSSMYYLDKDTTSEELVLKCLNDMLVTEYDGYIFYTHNFGKYDSIFLLKILKEENIRLGYEYYKTSDISRDNKILKLTIKIKRALGDRSIKKAISKIKPRVKTHSGYITITIVDSLNLLNQSLSALGDSFQVPVTKGNFPYSFVKRETLHYIGETPSYNYWVTPYLEDNLSLEEYNQLVKPDWNLKEECLRYLDRDLTSLLLIMGKFSEYINRKYYLQVTDSLTISRLALNIFLKDYLKDSKLPIINKGMFHNIKEAYYGGVTEVYKPYGTNLLHYDVNSLYPFAALNPMPGLQCVYIENIEGVIDLKDLFGFFYCEIKTENHYLGLLPVHHKEGMIMPNGTWKGWYFSEELKFASENGYTINVISGYDFNKVHDVFTKYVTDLYHIKSSTKDYVEKDIAKRLLNHLLGRFGLNIAKPITKYVNGSELALIYSTRKVIGKPEIITDNDFRVTYIDKVDKAICEEYGLDYFKVQKLSTKSDVEKLNEFRDVSLTTAAAVTAYARIYMSKIKLDIMNEGGTIYYTDTDSIVTNRPLKKHLVGDELGQFKLEYRIKKGYYISNKTYGVELAENITRKDGKVISEIIKSKAVLNRSLTMGNFKTLYKGIEVAATKRSAIKDYYQGSVKLVNANVVLKHDSYTKRDRIFKGSKWIDTKPLVLNGGVEVSRTTKVRKKESKISTVVSNDGELSNLGWNTLVVNKLLNQLLSLLYHVFILVLCVIFLLIGIEYDYSVGIDTEDVVNANYNYDIDVILESRYQDDYQEDYAVEPVKEYTSFECYSKVVSWFRDFLDLYMNKNSYVTNIYKHSSDSLVYMDKSNYVDNGDYDNERPQVLTTVLKHHLDSLVSEVDTIKKHNSRTEAQIYGFSNKINDALILCDKALRGSPLSNLDCINTSTYQDSTSYVNSPILQNVSSYVNSPILQSVTAFGDSPTTVTSSDNTPLLGRNPYNITRNSSFINSTSLSDKGSPLVERNSPLRTSTSVLPRYYALSQYEGLLIDNANSTSDKVNTTNNIINATNPTNSNNVAGNTVVGSDNVVGCISEGITPRKYPIRTETEQSLIRLKRLGHIWPNPFNVESPSVMKRYGWTTTSGGSILEEHSPYPDID